MATAFDRVVQVTSFNTQSSGSIRTIPAGRYAFLYISNIDSPSSLSVDPGGGAGGDTYSFVNADVSASPRGGSLEVALSPGDVVSATATAGNFVTGFILEFNIPS